MDAHWMENAERVTEGDYIGECDNGDLWAWKPNRTYAEARTFWAGRWVRFDRRNPRHLLVYWRSKRAGKVVMLEVSR